jgi:hypothetical protein
MAKLTLSISEEVRTRIDETAEELGLSRSAYVERLVAADAEAELERLLEEGYRSLAEQNLEIAESASFLTWEVVQGADPAR